ncbi:helicase-related protein [Psychromonas arctica]|uniref:helicase-related protein n=1 Tax=Psychromonas arctica TaxID=168275 RepID=UPI002FD73FF8
MDRIKETANLVKSLNHVRSGNLPDYEFIKLVCAYFDLIKSDDLQSADFQFLKFISNASGIPHYYDLLVDKFAREERLEEVDLKTMASMLYETSLHIDEKTKIHKFQKQILERFQKFEQNRYFLSATTSFGKTFLIYEIIKKLEYQNIALIFPTIALLSENYERLFTNDSYRFFYDEFNIHTLSDVEDLEPDSRNIFIYTPERYLSFVDKYSDINIDFVFVDEIYKIDNEYLIDTSNKENERDTAYRVALQNILSKTPDILLVGPYIEFPDKTNNALNQSFNTFLNNNHFQIIDYNNYEIVNKSIDVLHGRNNKIDNQLSIDLYGWSKNIGLKISKVYQDILSINENAIVYTRGAGTAEGYVKKSILAHVNNDNSKSDLLVKFINHLKGAFSFNDSWVIIQALENRIGIHHGLVPKYIQKEIINFFNQGDLDLLVSTTTITEGVNTSAKNLIVTNSRKGNKPLKTFDAKNIAGRAGRFLHHFSGRVIVLDKEFKDILDGNDDEIKHKNYDPEVEKDEIDYFITDEAFLSREDIERKRNILMEQQKRAIPDEIMAMYKVISHSHKIAVYDNIIKLSPIHGQRIRKLIKAINSQMFLDFEGFQVVLNSFRPVVTSDKLQRLIDNKTTVTRGKNAGRQYSVIVFMLSSYLNSGFRGSVQYILENKTKNTTKGKRPYTIDEAIRESSEFIFSTLKYQLVKYLGVFNLMYKYVISSRINVDMEEVSGIDRLLLKLEYNATTEKGRLASDYGVPSKLLDYYESGEKNGGEDLFDAFEFEKFLQIELIFNKK